MSQIPVGNVLVAFNKTELDRILGGSFSTIKELDDSINKQNAVLFNASPNNNFLSMTHEFNYSEGSQYAGAGGGENGSVFFVKFLDPENRFEREFLLRDQNSVFTAPGEIIATADTLGLASAPFNDIFDPAQVKQILDRKSLWIAYGCGDNFSKWAGPYHAYFESVNYDYTGDGVRIITMKFVCIPGVPLLENMGDIDAGHEQTRLYSTKYEIPLLKTNLIGFGINNNRNKARAERREALIDNTSQERFKESDVGVIIDNILLSLCNEYFNKLQGGRRRTITILPSIKKVASRYYEDVISSASNKAKHISLNSQDQVRGFSEGTSLESVIRSYLDEEALAKIIAIKTICERLGFHVSYKKTSRKETLSFSNEQVLDAVSKLGLRFQVLNFSTRTALDLNGQIFELPLRDPTEPDLLADTQARNQSIVDFINIGIPDGIFDQEEITAADKLRGKILQEITGGRQRQIFESSLESVSLSIEMRKEIGDNYHITPTRLFKYLSQISSDSFSPFWVYENDARFIQLFERNFGAKAFKPNVYDSALSLIGNRDFFDQIEAFVDPTRIDFVKPRVSKIKRLTSQIEALELQRINTTNRETIIDLVTQITRLRNTRNDEFQAIQDLTQNGFREFNDIGTTILIFGEKNLIRDYLYDREGVANLSQGLPDWPTIVRGSTDQRIDPSLRIEDCFGGDPFDIPDEFVLQNLKGILDIDEDKINDFETDLVLSRLHVFRHGTSNPNILNINANINEIYYASLLGTEFKVANPVGTKLTVDAQVTSFIRKITNSKNKLLNDISNIRESLEGTFSEDENTLRKAISQLGIDPFFLDYIKYNTDNAVSFEYFKDILRIALTTQANRKFTETVIPYMSKRNVVDALVDLVKKISSIAYFMSITTLPNFRLSNLNSLYGLNASVLVLVEEAKVLSSGTVKSRNINKVLSGFYRVLGFKHEVSQDKLESGFLLVRDFKQSIIPITGDEQAESDRTSTPTVFIENDVLNG